MILYAVMAETSVVKMFVAGIIPGILGAVGLATIHLRRRFPLALAVGTGGALVEDGRYGGKHSDAHSATSWKGRRTAPGTRPPSH